MGKSRHRERTGTRRTARAMVEPLECRRLLSTIVWANRDDPGNNFADTFGPLQFAARNVVDAVIRHWERAIESFNYTSATQLTLNIFMRDGAGDFGGQAPPSEISVDPSGAPRSGNIYLGRGNDVDGDGQGDGAGWYLDPEPDDFAEFPNITNAFLGGSDPGTAPAGLRDFYTLVAHEIGHVAGMTSASGSTWRSNITAFATNTQIDDTGGAGVLWAYQSPSVGRAVLTDSDGAGSGSRPVHTARGVQSFNFNGQQYDAAFDLMNNSYGVGNRRLISNLVLGMFQDVNGYDITWPEWFGTLYTMLDLGTGTLRLRGGAGDSDDIIRVFRSGSGYQVSVDVGVDVPGTGPTDAFVSFFEASDVSSIVIEAGGGDDLIQIRTLGSNTPVTIDAGTGNDRVELAIGDFDTNLLSDLVITGGGGNDVLWINDLTDGAGQDTWTISNFLLAKPSRQVTYIGFERVEILGSPNDDVFHLNSSPVLTDMIIHGNDGADRFEVAQPSGVLDSFSGAATLLGGNGHDVLNLYDNADTGADNYLFDAPGADNFNFTKSGGGAFFGILYSSIASLGLWANDEPNTIRVEQMFPAATLRGGAGDDEFVIGNGNLQAAVLSNLRLEGGTGSDLLLLDDVDDVGGDRHVFSGGLLTGQYTKDVMPVTISYLSIAEATLETAMGQSVEVVISETPAGLADLFINGNGFGADEVFVGTGNLSNVRANVHFDGFSDGKISFDDSAGSVLLFDLDFGQLSGTFTQTHTFSNTSQVMLTAGPGNNTLEIRNSFGYELVARMGEGDDVVNVGRGDIVGAGDATLFGGSGADELYFDNSSGSAPLTLVADQGAGLPYVDLYNGNIRTVYDGFALLQVESGPLNDTLRTVRVPMLTQVRLFAMGGDDQVYVDGHPDLNPALFPPTEVDVGSGMDVLEVNGDGVGGARARMSTSQSLAVLSVFSGGLLTLRETAQPGGNVLTTRALTATGRIDLRNGALIWDYDVPVNQEAFVASLIASGFNGGDWGGNGLATTLGDTTTFGLGYAEASDVIGPNGGMFLGHSVDATAILVRYTRYGDANLDGVVTLADLARLRSGFGSLRPLWSSGDFNYDWSVNLADLALLRDNFGLGL